jgi:hypothetical protein
MVEVSGEELNLINRMRALQTLRQGGIRTLENNAAQLLLARINDMLGGPGWLTAALKGLKDAAGVGTVNTVQLLEEMGRLREDRRSTRAMLWDLTQPQTPEQIEEDGRNIHTRDPDAAQRMIAVFRLTEKDAIG